MKTQLTSLLLLLSLSVFAAKVDTVMVQSECMDKSIPNLVITPDSYDGTTAYPVLYILHGAGGDYADWLRKAPKLTEYVDQNQFIIVCPDGGKTSWYFDSPIDETMQYETYVTDEFVSFIDDNYKTINDRSGRAIMGLSMGGHGAFYLAFRHQDIFGAAGSTSGGLDIRPFPHRWSIAKRLGEYAQNKQAWETNSVINHVYLLNQDHLKLIFDCGVDDFFYDANKRMHAKLVERNIPHDYTERPGGHTAKYWCNSVEYQILYFTKFFNAKK